MIKILAIGGSNSKNSINRKLVTYAANLVKNSEIEIVNISEMALPLFSVDIEAEIGTPEIVTDFANKIDNCDLIIISLAENNSSFNVGYKNLIDWTSRIKNRLTFNNKRMFLMATSPGGRGGMSVLESAKNIYPRMGANVLATFSLPSYYQNFEETLGITNPELKEQLLTIIYTF